MLQGSVDMSSTYSLWKGRLNWEYADGYMTVAMETWMTDGSMAQGKEVDGNNFVASITIAGQTKKFYYRVQFASMEVGSFSVAVSGTLVDVSGHIDPPYRAPMYQGDGKQMPLDGSETIDLNPKPKVNPSPVSASPNPVKMGKNVAIVMDREQAGVKHTLAYRFGSRSGTIAANVDGSYAWTVPDMADACVNATSGTCTITCTTFFEGENFGSTSCDITLNVPDATQVSASDGTLGTDMVVSIDPKSANFTHDILCEFHGVTVSIASGAKENVRWVPNYDLAKEIPSLTYGTATLKCTTKNGTAVVGETSKTIRLTVPENADTKPVISSVVLRPETNLEGNLATLYIKGKSGVRAEITASSAYSEIKGYETTFGSRKVSGNPAVLKVLSSSGRCNITVTVKDARGFTAVWEDQISVKAYESPRVTPYTGYEEVVCERALATGELSSNGTYLAIKAGCKFRSIAIGGEHLNDCTLRARWKENSAGSFGQWEELIGSAISSKEVQMLISDVVSSTKKSYTVEISAMDTIGGEADAHVVSFQISTSAISMVLYDGDDGVGFGKYPEGPHTVDIADHMTLIARGGVKFLGEQWVKMELDSNVSEPKSDVRLDGGCYYRVCNGNHVYIAFNVSTTISNGIRFINKNAIPEEYRPPHACYALCPYNSNGIALVAVNNGGWIIAKMLYPEYGGEAVAVNWIDGYIDYWI